MADWGHLQVLQMAEELRDLADDSSEEMQRDGAAGSGQHGHGCGHG